MVTGTAQSDTGTHPGIPISPPRGPGTVAHDPQTPTMPSFTWMDTIPGHLRKRFIWAPVALPPDTAPTILLLYAGRDDAGSLDSCIHAYHPDLSPRVCAIDTRREAGKHGQDILADMPYALFCTMAMKGLLPLVGGGPKCRTRASCAGFPNQPAIGQGMATLRIESCETRGRGI